MIPLAAFSPDRTYRYALSRTWLTGHGSMLVIGLNPSTADEIRDDPTIRRCIRFARDDGYAGLMIGNLFAFRSTDPRGLTGTGVEPVGPENDHWLLMMAREAEIVVCAWGTKGGLLGRDQHVVNLLRRNGHNLCVLETTKDGHPAHPLYLRADLRPMTWMLANRNLKE